MPACSIAARFAAKEAIAKAFGTGITENMGWKDIEIVNNAQGKPEVILAAHLEKEQALFVQLSISHCHTYAIAFAVIETVSRAR